MGKIDIATKRFVSIPDIFAQLFTVGLFKGDIVVREEGLTDMNSLENVRMEKSQDKELLERIRDVKKMSDLGFALAILGIEDQSVVHHYMPVRAMMYDAVSYETQFKSICEECEKDGIMIPYGAGVLKGTKVVPVITIVLYTGKEPWDGPREIFDLLEIPEDKKEFMQRFMNNYKLHVIDARHMSDEEINQYSGDLKAFFVMLRDSYDKEMLRGVIAKHKETWYAISDIKKDERYRKLIDHVNNETMSGGVDMCETLDYYEQLGEERGIKLGIEQGIKLGEERGIEQGIKLGEERGIDVMGELTLRLIEAGRMEDLERAIKDKEYRKKLFAEFGLQ